MLHRELAVLLTCTEELEQRVVVSDDEYHQVCRALALEKQKSAKIQNNTAVDLDSEIRDAEKQRIAQFQLEMSVEKQKTAQLHGIGLARRSQYKSRSPGARQQRQ